MTKSNRGILQEIFDLEGEEAVVERAVENLSELLSALCKVKRTQSLERSIFARAVVSIDELKLWLGSEDVSRQFYIQRLLKEAEK